MIEDNKTALDKSRLRVMSVEVKVAYTDGFVSTLESPPFITRGYSNSVLAPGGAKTPVEMVNVGAMKKAVDLLEGVLKDVRESLPSQEEVDKSRAEIAADQAEAVRSSGALDISQLQK